LKTAQIARNASAVIFPLARAPATAAMACSLIAIAGCTTSGLATAYTPITGIQIPAADVVAGHGCGRGSGQVYKYAAVVAYPVDGGVPGMPLTSGVFDCFADGIFSNLPVIDGGPLVFDVSIYAYDKDSFPRALDCPQSVVPCPGDDASAILPWETAANWTAICTASQFQGITTVAACGPLLPSPVHSSQSDAATE
jgi:hypothetical protein